jgi:hypothetical protein
LVTVMVLRDGLGVVALVRGAPCFAVGSVFLLVEKHSQTFP